MAGQAAVFRAVLTTALSLTTHLNAATTDGKITIGYLMDQLGPPYRAGAISLAVNQAQNDGLLYDFNISMKAWPTDCTTLNLTFTALQMMISDGIDALVGPSCQIGCDTITPLASFWNVPFLPEKCRSSATSTISKYSTLFLIAGSWTTFARSFDLLSQFYNWLHIMVISDQNTTGYCSRSSTAIYGWLTSQPLPYVVSWIQLATSPSAFDLLDSLQQLRQRARVAYFCHTNLAVEQRWLFAAQDANMTNGDYALLTYRDLSSATTAAWLGYNMTGVDLTYRRKAFWPVKQIAILQDFANVNDLLQQVATASSLPPWNLNSTSPPDLTSLYLYDTVYAYLSTMNTLVNNGSSDRQGNAFLSAAIAKRNFSGKTGSIVIGSNGARINQYSILSFSIANNTFYPYMSIDLTQPSGQMINVLTAAEWGLYDTAPLDEPPCGYSNQLCPTLDDNNGNVIIAVCCCVAAVVIALAATLYIRDKRMTSRIREMSWKINYHELVFGAVTSSHSSQSSDEQLLPGTQNRAIYRGLDVAVVHINKHDIKLSRQDLLDLVSLKEIVNENILPFVGACVQAGNNCYVTLYCSRGTVQDIVFDEEMKLDAAFRMSLISDLVNGMLYVHKSAFQSHGHLTSDHCHVDSRWVLKIGGFGLSAFQDNDTLSYRDLLWTAPELLRMERRPLRGTQKGDVFSFAIILQQIVYGAAPYFYDGGDAREVIEHVRAGMAPFCRPTPPRNAVADIEPDVLVMMTQCWEEKPEDRPSFDDVTKTLKKINRGKKFNFMDGVLQKLEKYANNLEGLVKLRTTELEEEKRKTDLLLYQMLPPFVADELKLGRQVAPQLYASATIYFSDIVGFTDMSSESTPLEVVDLLNDLYGVFDDTISHHDVYKVETIGDAYMVVSGLPKLNEGRHVCEISNMAMDLLDKVSQFKIRHRPNEKLKLRIGIHTGPCAAGVVGHSMPRYCLFGDTVNVASRMESTGEALKIHLSEMAQSALSKFPLYITELRGETYVKGKGMLPTFWLVGKKSYDSVNKS